MTSEQNKPREWILTSENLIHKVEGPCYSSTDRIPVIEKSYVDKVVKWLKLSQGVRDTLQKENDEKAKRIETLENALKKGHKLIEYDSFGIGIEATSLMHWKKETQQLLEGAE